MAEVLTAEQKLAVENRGRSLLVSAAAGSGKTKVLVDRLFSYLEDGETNLDDFLIITYTRAAAAELRGKIAKVLARKLQEDPTNAHLRRQMLHLYRADIKTVDAFCTALLRENCHLIREDAHGHGLRPDFRVLDESEAQMLRERILGRVLEEFYDDLDAGGVLLADTLGAGRDDRKLTALVLELHKKLQAQPYAEQWIAEQEAFWSDLPRNIEDTPYGAALLADMQRKALHWRAVFLSVIEEMTGNEALNDKYVPHFLDVAGQLAQLAAACDTGWDTAAKCTVVFPRLSAVRADAGGTLKNRAKSLWDSAKKSLAAHCAMFDATAEEMVSDLRTMAPAMCSLLALTARFSAAYQQEKRRRNAADFSDQEHEAIALLRDENGMPTELARSVAGRYREIMVDEYQDTNEVQNCIFEAISRGGKNLFTVGDVKQSIYRFRLADPTIFLDHYERYPHVSDAREGESAKLLLSRNFRSRAEVLEATNYVFSNLLSREMGELDYGADEMLHVGADYPEKTDANTEFHVIDLTAQEDSEEETLRAADAEADFVAGYIKDLLTSKFTVQDEKTKELRPIREEDIVILMRSPSARLATYRRALEVRGIDCAAEGSGAFYETMEIAVIFALLRVIDNPRQDVPLISVLRSPLFAFSPNRLAAIRANLPRGEFYDALAADEGEDTAAFLALLRELRNLAQEMSTYELLQLVYERCNVRAIFGAMPRGRERRENLEAFLALSADLDGAGFRHLFDFVMHLQDLLAADQAPVPQISRAEAGVRIMTIHKSKGLEFPVVILSDLAKPFNDLDFRTSVLVHPKSGLGPVCVDRDRMIQYPTVAREAIERQLRREAKSEELRILYVAMTRAKEKLVMVYTHKNAEKQLARLSAMASCPVLSETVAEQKCLGDWLLLTVLTRPEARVLREIAGAEEEKLYLGEDARWNVFFHEGTSAQKRFRHGNETALPAEGEEPDTAALAFRYPHAQAVNLPAKLTATQLKGRMIDAEISEHATLPPRLRSLKRPQFLSGTRDLGAAERGTAIHALLEHLPFSTQAEVGAVEAVISDLLERKLLTQDQAKAIDRNVILRFLQSPLCARLRAAEHVEREYHFSLLRPVNEVLKGEETDEVLLQGVVDCFFEENGELIVVDFKTDRIRSDQLHERSEQYRPQLEAYAAALERVMEQPVGEKILCFLHLGEEVQL